MAHLPKLETLGYNAEYSDGMELARLIQDGKLPCLRDVNIVFYRTIDVSKEIDNARYTEVSEELRKVCNLSSRQVFKPCNTLEEIERRLDFTE